jgi:hypothetical protein
VNVYKGKVAPSSGSGVMHTAHTHIEREKETFTLCAHGERAVCLAYLIKNKSLIQHLNAQCTTQADHIYRVRARAAGDEKTV